MKILAATGAIGAILLIGGAVSFTYDNVITNMMASPRYAAGIAQARESALSPSEPPPTTGQPFAVLRIPAIGLVAPVVEGVDQAQLADGVGHYPSTPLPGQAGNVALAGHRTTHGRPFWSLGDLKAGDDITITYAGTVTTYHVTSRAIVDPTDISVLDPPPLRAVRELTLTTCHPKFSARKRLIIHAITERATPK